MIGRLVSNPFTELVKNGEAKALFAEVELSTGDIRTVQLFPGANADRWPCEGDVAVVERVGGPTGILLYAVAVWDGEEPSLAPGELEIYSRDADRNRVARMHFDNEGNATSKFDGNAKTRVDKDAETSIGGNESRLVEGDRNTLIEGDNTTSVEGDYVTDIGGYEKRAIAQYVETEIGEYMKTKVKKDYSLDVGGDIDMESVGSANIKAAVINLN
jgi:hypothetical protein